ncbi:hypothetical protein NPIL_324801 [Nephila pilipes]|uniref:Uncharacterized protein n=1 Tax=Nephila pilipes TaxID=299642 RepID=A0A8X6TGN3_NEPPI|nr:hypothetical protein NPIL_324801 [Nephila pilipes]
MEKYHRGSICPFFPGNLDKEYYKDVLEKIGFKDVRSERKDTIIEYNPGQENFENLLQVREQSFAIPESLKNRFKRETLKFLAELLDGPETGPLHYTSREIYLFAVKPFDSNVSEVEKPSV